MDKKLTSSLGKISKKILLYSYIIIAIMLISISILGIINAKRGVLQAARSEFNERELSLESAINKAINHVKILKYISDLNIKVDTDNIVYDYYKDELIQKSIYNINEDYFILNTPEKVGSFIVESDIFSTGKAEDITPEAFSFYKVSLILSSFQKSDLRTNKNIVLSYFISDKIDFSFIYPSIGVDKYIKETGNLTTFIKDASSVYTGFINREDDRDKGYFWTKPYLDRVGHGMMVTCASSYYLKGEYIGVYGVDIKLDFLDSYTKSLNSVKSDIILVSDYGQILSSTNISYTDEKEVIMIDAEDLKMDSYVSKKRLSNSPWTIYLRVKDRDILTTLKSTVLMLIIMILLILITLLLVFFKINSKLIQPGIEAENRVKQINVELNESLDKLTLATKQIVEGEKMASIGNLVVGVAHEINTPIGIGVTAASHLDEESEKLKQKFLQGSLTKSDFESFFDIVSNSSSIILSNIQKTAELVKTFKQVAVDGSTLNKRKFNLKSYIKNYVLKQDFIDNNNNLKVNIESDDNIIIESYPGVISQVINNLLKNSIQHGFRNNTGVIDIDILEHIEHISIIYSDSGVGVDKKSIKSIFEPFYTTSRIDGNIGLGLYIVYNQVTQKLLGDIVFISPSTFEIKIPK